MPNEFSIKSTLLFEGEAGDTVVVSIIYYATEHTKQMEEHAHTCANHRNFSAVELQTNCGIISIRKDLVKPKDSDNHNRVYMGQWGDSGYQVIQQAQQKKH